MGFAYLENFNHYTSITDLNIHPYMDISDNGTAFSLNTNSFGGTNLYANNTASGSFDINFKIPDGTHTLTLKIYSSFSPTWGASYSDMIFYSGGTAARIYSAGTSGGYQKFAIVTNDGTTYTDYIVPTGDMIDIEVVVEKDSISRIYINYVHYASTTYQNDTKILGSGRFHGRQRQANMTNVLVASNMGYLGPLLVSDIEPEQVSNIGWTGFIPSDIRSQSSYINSADVSDIIILNPNITSTLSNVKYFGVSDSTAAAGTLGMAYNNISDGSTNKISGDIAYNKMVCQNTHVYSKDDFGLSGYWNDIDMGNFTHEITRDS